jgi:hypothetical protein
MDGSFFKVADFSYAQQVGGLLHFGAGELQVNNRYCLMSIQLNRDKFLVMTLLNVAALVA